MCRQNKPLVIPDPLCECVANRRDLRIRLEIFQHRFVLPGPGMISGGVGSTLMLSVDQ